MAMFEDLNELRAKSGIGCGLYKKNASGKFSLYLPLETVPVVSGTPTSIDIDVTTSKAITKIEGKTTLEDKEVSFFVHRDSIRKLKASAGKVEEFLVVNPDYTGYRYNGSVAIAQNDSTSGEALAGTIKITPTMDGGFVDNCYDLLEPTAKFATPIPDTVSLETSTGTFELNVETAPSDATIAATSESETIATATFAVGKVTITGKIKGSSVVKLAASKVGFASWETTILVIVP